MGMAYPPARQAERPVAPGGNATESALVRGAGANLIWRDPDVVSFFVAALEAERNAGDGIWDKSGAYRRATESCGVVGLTRTEGYNRFLQQITELAEGTQGVGAPEEQERLAALRNRLLGLMGQVEHLRRL